jgi:hypothetical protein
MDDLVNRIVFFFSLWVLVFYSCFAMDDDDLSDRLDETDVSQTLTGINNIAGVRSTSQTKINSNLI